MHATRFCFTPALVLAGLLLLSGCTTSSTKSINAITDNNTTYFTDPEERELFDEAEKLHQEFVRKGLIYRNTELSKYIQQLGQDLQPEKVKNTFRLEFYVFRDPSVNAFALPNGNIYINLGLLNKLDNEAQLAFVMAHEAAHIIERHSFKGKIERRNELVAAHLADFLLAGTGLSYLAAVSGISKHSREMETEADTLAFGFIANTHYQPQAVIDTFNLLVETKHKNPETGVWDSHPAAALRTANAKRFFERHPSTGNQINSARFSQLQNDLAERTIKMRLHKKQFQMAEEDTERTIERQGKSAQWLTYLGESYRLRTKNRTAAVQEQMWLYDEKKDTAEQWFDKNLDDFKQKAQSYYQQALTDNPDYPRAYRGMGLLLAEQGEQEQANQYLQKYLRFSNISDRRYISTFITQ